jgi:hypothetical protein
MYQTCAKPVSSMRSLVDRSGRMMVNVFGIWQVHDTPICKFGFDLAPMRQPEVELLGRQSDSSGRK